MYLPHPRLNEDHEGEPKEIRRVDGRRIRLHDRRPELARMQQRFFPEKHTMARLQGDVLVVVSHYNAWPTDQLFSLLDQISNVRSGCPFGVRIVVNQARPVRLNLPERYAGIDVIHRENTGFNIGAWEAGWRAEPRREFYLFLQEECRIVRPGWLQPFVSLARNPRVGLVGELSNEHWDARWSFLTYHSRYYRQETVNSADARAFDEVSYNLNYLEQKGIPRGPRGDHLQSLVLCSRRSVLEVVGGFELGGNYEEAVATEVAMSKKIQALGLAVKQVGLHPFTYIEHPQWDDLAPSSWSRVKRIRKTIRACLRRLTPTRVEEQYRYLMMSMGKYWPR